MPYFIAERSEHSWIVFLIFGAIWVISAIIGAVNKAQEKAKREQVRRSLEGSIPPAPLQPQRAPEMFQPQVARRTPAQPQSFARPVQQVRQAPRQAARRAPARVPVARDAKRGAPRTAPPPIPARQVQAQPAPAPIPAAKQDISATEIRSGAKPTRATGRVTAESLHGWLRPETLRQQFMLTEVLQPPLALREPRH